MLRKPTTSKSTLALPESPTILCPSWPLAISTVVVHSTAPASQYSQCPSYRSHVNRHDTMGYPYPRDVAYTNPSQRPPFSSADQTNNKYLLEDLTF